MTTQTNSINQPVNDGTCDAELQENCAPSVADVDQDFFATLAEHFGAAHDCPSGGFWLNGMHVLRRRMFIDGERVHENCPIGFDRWRLAGLDGVPRTGDRNAPAVIYSRDGDAFMLTRRDNLKPKPLTFTQLVALLSKHARGERV